MKSVELVGRILLLFGVLVSGSLYGQSITTVKANDIDYGRAFRFNVKSDGVRGTPFLYDEPKSAKISLDGGKVYEDIPFNILPEKEEIYIQTGGEESDPLVLKNWIWLETLEDSPKLFRMEYLEGKQRIVEILYEKGSEKYVALHTKYLVKPTNLKDGYTGPQYDTYKPDVRFYKINGLQSQEFKGNTSGLKELSSDRYNELRDYIKNEKLKTETADDMKKVLVFLFD
ncbi:hypothetical protein [Shivajiella indica]|uniref:Uncharacterized protein n=1 Tax=Shivajiella indica TaxID=872115 RepID=A0ABW5B6S6_9BACT